MMRRNLIVGLSALILLTVGGVLFLQAPTGGGSGDTVEVYAVSKVLRYLRTSIEATGESRVPNTETALASLNAHYPTILARKPPGWSFEVEPRAVGKVYSSVPMESPLLSANKGPRRFVISRGGKITENIE